MNSPVGDLGLMHCSLRSNMIMKTLNERIHFETVLVIPPSPLSNGAHKFKVISIAQAYTFELNDALM